MKLKEFADVVEQLIIAGRGECEVVSCIDEEGTEFKPVYYYPSYGKFSRKDRGFVALSGKPEDDAEYQDELDALDSPVDAVCVN